MMEVRPVELYFSMHAWEQIEHDLWPLEEMEDQLRGALSSADGIVKLCRLIAILRNAAAELDGRPERVTGEDVLRSATAESLTASIRQAAEAIVDGLRTEGPKKSAPVDVTLAELDKAEGRNRVTWRRVTGEGLIAGISVTEQRHLRPGLVVDLYRQRQQYDDEQHGIKRNGGADPWPSTQN